MTTKEKCELNTDTFASHVFSDSVMRERLTEEVYQEYRKTVDEGSELSSEAADQIADAMMQWALQNGATHYTHWFQPLTGFTAEKHDAFLTPSGNGKAINEFSHKALIKGEPDASSFPSGGLRSTFEARGYTAWDCSSPAFLKHDKAGVTLCIPTAFCAYNGLALDKKTPLLKSAEAVNKQAMRILKLFGNCTTKKVNATAGAEQEYFLIDRDLYKKRQDLQITGRTLFGARPPKAQEMDDHYFGTLKERVSCFMRELDEELWKMGVYAKTEHNEAAPAQHELAPVFTDVNVATDHNQLIMETLKRVAAHHGFACLLHEKPFEGVNGSGKHNNWSLSTDDGINLLDPGKTPEDNAQFLLFLCAVMKAVDEFPGLLRASAASAGNEHRLGGFEAPPAIISMFLGEQLTEILNRIERGEHAEPASKSKLEIPVAAIPNLSTDSTDRNRTSPFAFTGNKFEFRMVGSSASIAGPNTVINTIVAHELKEFADVLEKTDDITSALQELLKKTIREHKRIIFNGNGYSNKWIRQAEAQGFPNITNSVDAYQEYVKEKAVRVFEEQNVYTEAELQARYEIKVSKYSKTIGIEARTAIQMAKRQILPACLNYSTSLAQNIKALENLVSAEAIKPRKEFLNRYLTLLNSLEKTAYELEEKVSAIQNNDMDFYEEAVICRDGVLPIMNEMRKFADTLETMTGREDWPMPTYSDLIL